MYLAARGSNYETQKQTIPEQKRIQKDVRTTERARSNSVSGTRTHTYKKQQQERPLFPRSSGEPNYGLKNGLWFINTGSWVTTF
jgi:hypothetical protein